jgi:hypothetical protein
MEVTGKLVYMLPVQTGQGKNGQWKKQDFVIEVPGNFPKKICLSAWGDKVDTSGLAAGDTLKVSFDIESREYNGRWYTDVKAYAIQHVSDSGFSNQPPPPAATSANDNSIMIEEVSDDLPF